MRVFEVAQTWAVTAVAVVVPRMADLKDGAQTLAALAALGFTVWTWRRKAQRKHNESREGAKRTKGER